MVGMPAANTGTGAKQRFKVLPAVSDTVEPPNPLVVRIQRIVLPVSLLAVWPCSPCMLTLAQSVVPGHVVETPKQQPKPASTPSVQDHTW